MFNLPTSAFTALGFSRYSTGARDRFVTRCLGGNFQESCLANELRNVVGTDALQDGSVTTPVLANGAVTNEKIAEDTIEQSKLTADALALITPSTAYTLNEASDTFTLTTGDSLGGLPFRDGATYFLIGQVIADAGTTLVVTTNEGATTVYTTAAFPTTGAVVFVIPVIFVAQTDFRITVSGASLLTGILQLTDMGPSVNTVYIT